MFIAEFSLEPGTTLFASLLQDSEHYTKVCVCGGEIVDEKSFKCPTQKANVNQV